MSVAAVAPALVSGDKCNGLVVEVSIMQMKCLMTLEVWLQDRQVVMSYEK
jgi:hypothetical protein